MADPNDMTDEQLDAYLSELQVDDAGNLPDSVPDPEPKDDEAEEPEADAEADAEPEEAEDEAEEAEASDEDEDEDESDEDDEGEGDDEFSDLPDGARANMEKVLTRLELIEAENERLQADLDRASLMRDRLAGKAGSQKQKARAGDDDADPDEFDDEGEDAKSKPSREAQEALAEIRAEKVERALGNASAQFYDANQEFFQALHEQVGPEANQEFQAELIAKVREGQAALGEDILTMNPKTAAKVGETLLRSAFADMKLQLIRDLQTKASDQADESRRKIRERKKGAAGTRSNKRPAAQATPNKSAQEMTDKELDAALAEAAKLLD